MESSEPYALTTCEWPAQDEYSIANVPHARAICPCDWTAYYACAKLVCMLMFVQYVRCVSQSMFVGSLIAVSLDWMPSWNSQLVYQEIGFISVP